MSSCSRRRAETLTHGLSPAYTSLSPKHHLKSREFHTAPCSPPVSRRSSPSHSLDLQILTHKLQLHQLEEEASRLRAQEQKRMEDRQAADVAAAARFRDQVEKLEQSGSAARDTRQVSRSASGKDDMFSGALRRSSSSKMVRTKKPLPLQLSLQPIQPQQAQSVALPAERPGRATEEMKKHWRRTTISAPRDHANKVLLVSSPGESTECDYVAAEPPPVPQLSLSAVSSPCVASPITPMHVEDGIRRQLEEEFILQEAPSSHIRRGLSAATQRPLAVYIPDPGDAEEKALPPPPSKSIRLNEDEACLPRSSPTWRGRVLSKLARRHDVDAVLDMYYTNSATEVGVLKKKPSRLRRQTIFRAFRSTEPVDGRI